MQIKLDEIESNIFRIAGFPPNGFISFNHFVIRDENPALIHTGHKKTFNLIYEHVAKIINPNTIRYLCFSHFEPDECGSLNEWLGVAPQAVACINKICDSSVNDYAIRPSLILKDGDRLNLGVHELLFLETPHFPHNWEASLFHEVTTKTLFSSDLGTQRGFPQESGTAVDIEDILTLQKRLRYIPFGVHLTEGLNKMRDLSIENMATMHGSPLNKQEIKDLLAILEDENRTQMERALYAYL